MILTFSKKNKKKNTLSLLLSLARLYWDRISLKLNKIKLLEYPEACAMRRYPQKIGTFFFSIDSLAVVTV